jgi:tetratricopeptide (TPR) repeat protein
LSVFASLLLLYAIPVSAKTVTHTKEYTYQASEADSKLSSRTIALEQVKRLLLEELGTYLLSETTVINFELTKDQITSITAGIVMTLIIDERWDGKFYYLKAKITTDVDQMERLIDMARRDREKNRNFDDIRKNTEDALKEIERLKKEIGNIEGEKINKDKYAKTVNKLNAINLFSEGYALFKLYSDNPNEEAMKAYDKAIEMDPNYANAYAGRAAIYNHRFEWKKALIESQQAIKIDPTLPWAYNCRGNAQRGLRNFKESIEDFNKAIELDPEYTWPYSNRSLTYYRLKNYHQALLDANKAIELNPNFHRAYIHRGMAHTSLNHYQEAIKDYERAIKIDPTKSLPYLNRGYVYLKLDKPEQALEDIKKAASLGNTEAQRYLKEKEVR